MKTTSEHARGTEKWTCPICGRPFSAVDLVLFEHDVSYQCRYCWNRIRGTGSGVEPLSLTGKGLARHHKASRN